MKQSSLISTAHAAGVTIATIVIGSALITGDPHGGVSLTIVALKSSRDTLES